MNQQPTFASPVEVIKFIRSCLDQDDAVKLYAACSEKTSDFWKERIFQYLLQIEEAETLERVFLEDGRIGPFPEQETVMHLGGHDPRTRYIHIKLAKSAQGWVLESIQVCRS